MIKILTFDIEEWFHILDNESTKAVKNWGNFEIRIHTNMERIFSILEPTKTKATFFCLGWIAKKYPEVIKEIANRGYHIASHAYTHQLAYEQKPEDFKQDVDRSIKILEDLTGKEIKCFRAPGFSIQEKNKWAFEILTSLGIDVDSSIFPAHRAHGGFPTYKEPLPSILKYENAELKELPINYIDFYAKSVIFSGGGYFRFFPYPLIRYWANKSEYMMTYFHPRDFDPAQPMINGLSYARMFKSYIGLKSAANKLKLLLNDFEFTDIPTAIKMIDWKNVPVVQI